MLRLIWPHKTSQRSNLSRHTDTGHEFDLNAWDLATSANDAQSRLHLNRVVRFVAALAVVLVIAGAFSL